MSLPYVPGAVIVLGGIGAQQIMRLTVDPSVGAGVAAPVGTLGLRSNGDVWSKNGAADTAWAAIAASASITNADGIYGNGDDGSVVDAVSRTLDRVYLYEDWTIQAGAVITPARWPVFVRGTLTLAGSIVEDGAAGVGQLGGGTGGGASGTGYLGVGSAAGNGGGGGSPGSAGSASSSQPRSIGVRGTGGAGGLSGSGGGAGAGGALTLAVASLGAPYVAAPSLGYFTNSIGTSPINGGSGGGGGGGGAATGGRGGGGGGVVVIIAKNIVVTGAGLIAARGGAGAAGVAGNGGGGGGGGGGKVLIIRRSYTGTAPSVAAGAAGAGQGTGVAGSGGTAGQAVQLAM